MMRPTSVRILNQIFVPMANNFPISFSLLSTPVFFEANYSTIHGTNYQNEHRGGNNVACDFTKTPLAESLASLVIESSCNDQVDRHKPQMTRTGMKRLLELCIKKRVKRQYLNGKYHDLIDKVVSDPNTLMDAYNCIRVSSNVDTTSSEITDICVESLAEELSNGNFDVGANTFTISTKGRAEKEYLVLPNLKLKVVQEAMRVVLEVVFKPHFSKISHGGRNGRGHMSAFKYICKEISDPDWWFTVHLNKKIDDQILAKLTTTIEDKIKDPKLSAMIKIMFNAQVLNLEFGGFSKGQGLPQEGILSPILMNIYLDLFDNEFERMSMRYEALDSVSFLLDQNQPQSKLRGWLRRKIKGDTENSIGDRNHHSVRVYSCRFMDEIFFAVSGTKQVALLFKSEVQNYFQEFLHLDVDSLYKEVTPSNSRNGVRFAGALIVRTVRNTPAVRAVHKLKEKVKLLGLQKQEIWDDWTLRIGKKWLAHGLKKVKESEIKHLADNNSLLTKISCYRKPGMETDHWYKQLIKILMQATNANSASNEEIILSRYIAEPSLPPTLRDSYYEFQRRVEEYTSAETESLLSLMQDSEFSSPQQLETVSKVVAPVNVVKKRLLRYGLVNNEGYGRAIPALILQDESQIIDWYTGIIHRWMRWYGECDNLNELKRIISDQVRKSCIRTLALKYRIHEDEIEKKFESELSQIPLTHDIEHIIHNKASDFHTLENDEALMYGVLYSGLCQLSVARIVSESRPCKCFVTCCSDPAPCVYTLHVKERQKFPGWNTGFSSCIHPSLNRRRIGLCKKHLQDLYLGYISLQSVEFGSWK